MWLNIMLHEKKLLHFSGKMLFFLFKVASFVLLRPSAAFQRIKFNVSKASPTKTSLWIQEKCCKNPPSLLESLIRINLTAHPKNTAGHSQPIRIKVLMDEREEKK